MSLFLIQARPLLLYLNLYLRAMRTLYFGNSSTTRHIFHSCCGGGNVLPSQFPLFPSRHMKVVSTAADVTAPAVEKVGRQKYLH